MSVPAAKLNPVVTVREARSGDLDALLALEHAAFASDRAERRAIRHAIASPSMTLLVALVDEASAEPVLVGAATIERRRGSRNARLSSIAVSPARAGLGLGGLLLDAAEADARRHGCTRLRLEVRADNGAGIRLYERRGYVRFTVRPDYYEDGMEAWRYEKALGEARPGPRTRRSAPRA
ncbi:GNAT family N-acetyltransferase [Methylobacterium planeticum]|uniref:GNAT family N-acetyltransferase n=1 Tax=Methylobacterium planeticum TaxID=2615211 RepID=UPI0038990F47